MTDTPSESGDSPPHASVRGRNRSRVRPRGKLLKAGVSALLVGSVTAIAGCTATTTNADGDTVLKVADSFAATHPIGRSGTKVFLDILETEGPVANLQIEHFASGQLGKQRDMPALLRTGVAQIAAVSPAYVGTQLPLSNVGDLPGFTQDSCAGADAVREIMQPGSTLFEAELLRQDIHPLWVAFIPGYEAMSGDFPIESVADLHGKIMRSTGGAADRVVDVAGAAGVSMPLGDLYESISRGTVEGTLASPLSVTPYKLEEVLRYSTDGAQLGSFTATYSMSHSEWLSMTDGQRALMTKASDAAQSAVCVEINQAMETSKVAMREAGVQMSEVKDTDRAAWAAIYGTVQQEWTRDLESMGLPAQQVLDEFSDALARAEDQHGGMDQ
ncbi:TRAP transporter substrate-binding protein [Tomitella biformata]|uniref:TRAP transporter substrate-binding protein n=1 Tax=Tomitella biformata TaxID=630403 RepID=UPI00046426E6|nr:TRAP transporter substrate-binding protein DctP [Tomitella biformata]